jgi:hypothetical protein
MATYTLTQNLYALEEAVLALLTALLKKNDQKECHYWLNEISLSVSETELRKILGQIYYDFYYILNPTVVNELMSMDINRLIDKLFLLDNSPFVFILCQAKPVKPKFVYINKKPATWLVELNDERLHDFMRAVNKSHYDGICYHANKLLLKEGLSGEALVKALCSYFKKPFIEKVPTMMRDDFQYVMTVYAYLHCKTEYISLSSEMASLKLDTAFAPTAFGQKYIIPPTIAGFKLRRWQQVYGKTIVSPKERLLYDPILIAFGLSLKGSNSLTDMFSAVTNYIKIHLNAEELDLFTGMPADEEEDMQTIADQNYADILKEQQTQQQLWLQQYPGAKLVERLPTFGTVWLSEVFPNLEAKMLDLIKYKMFEIY